MSDSGVNRRREPTAVGKDKKCSLEEHHISCGAGKWDSPPYFEKTHRRVRSGDAGLFNITNNHERPFASMGPTGPQYSDLGGHPHIRTESDPMNYYQSPVNPPYISSMSVDGYGDTHALSALTVKQTNQLIALQMATEAAETEEHQLKQKVDELNRQLDVELAIETHTEKDCKKLEDEILQLEKQLQLVYNEMDQYKFVVDGDSPMSPNPNPPDFRTHRTSQHQYHQQDSYHHQPPRYGPTSPVYPPKPPGPGPLIAAPATPPVTVQPGATPQRQRSTIPKYENLPPDFPPLTSPRTGSQPSSHAPPPVPPRIPTNQRQIEGAMNEKWSCPACTFDNLIVPFCEICGTPRPGPLVGHGMAGR